MNSLRSFDVAMNRKFEDWADIFGDAVLAGAIVDRIIHHAHVIRIVGNSYRTKHLQPHDEPSQKEKTS